ncbi:MAG TPA: LysE family transporter [Bacteroidota bacterium]|jgi:threonine/homoserine/homoserine lactone efflux protein|nr:LysE family transporter [Bacteroidota bacterium]
MEPIFFLQGLIIGFAMEVPIGPLGVLCVRKTLTEGHTRGMIIGLGAATADSLFGSIAVFGLTFISDVINSQHFWVSLVGGAVLLLLGIRTLRAKHRAPSNRFDNKGLFGSYLSALLLALTNPVTILAFVAVFAVFGLGHALVIISASTLIIGVFTGSWLWFLTLSHLAILFKKKLNAGGLRWVTRVSGALIILSGVTVFASLI